MTSINYQLYNNEVTVCITRKHGYITLNKVMCAQYMAKCLRVNRCDGSLLESRWEITMTKITFRVHTQSSTHYFYLAQSEAELREQLGAEPWWRQHPQAAITITPVLGDRQGILSEVLHAMDIGWRYRWCEAGICGCMGCSNISGSLRRLGFTKAEWDMWVKRNPDPRPPINYAAMHDELIIALSTKH